MYSHQSCIKSLSLLCCCIVICCCCEVALAAEVAMAAERTLSAALILRESMSLKALTLFISLREADYEQNQITIRESYLKICKKLICNIAGECEWAKIVLASSYLVLNSTLNKLQS